MCASGLRQHEDSGCPGRRKPLFHLQHSTKEARDQRAEMIVGTLAEMNGK